MKNRKDISDIELDELFKKASKSVQPEFEESSWEAFEAKLDSANIETKGTVFNSRNLLALLGIFFLVGLLSINYFWDSKTEEASKLSDNVISETKSSASDIRSTESDKSMALEEKVDKDDRALNGSETEKLIVEKNTEKLVQESIGANQSKSIPEKANAAKSSNSDLKASKKLNSTSSSKGDLRFSNVKTKNSSFDKTSKETALKSAGANSSQEVIEEERELNKKTIALDANSLTSLNTIQVSPYQIDRAFKGEISKFKSSTEKIEIEPRAKPQNKIFLTVGVSPDFSKVLENSFLKMGYNWSAQLEYHFNERWSVHSGIILSEKFYGTNVDGMYWPNYWGDMPKEMKGMEGSCNVIDIPLNLRYNFKYNDKNKMYLVGGVSSFIMMNEQYEYLYPEGFNSEGMKTNWSIKDSGFLAAGMANFSIGYERKIGEVFSIQLEPFVKIPIRDFGFSQVKLATTGVFFTGKVRIK